jgi:Mg2+-importing ATPase
MLRLFHAGERLFQTGWFVESLATQTLVIFVIRTAAPPWTSRPSRALTATVGACVATGALLPYTPVAPWFGLVPLPPLFFAVLLGMVSAYLALVEIVKRRFYRHEAP